MFSCSIAENIAYGADEPSLVTAAQVERVADAANATAFIRGFPRGFNTVVGEKGVLLSGAWRLRPRGPRGPLALRPSARPQCLEGPEPHVHSPKPLPRGASSSASLASSPAWGRGGGVAWGSHTVAAARALSLRRSRSRAGPGGGPAGTARAQPPQGHRPHEVCHVASSSLVFLTVCKM